MRSPRWLAAAATRLARDAGRRRTVLAVLVGLTISNAAIWHTSGAAFNSTTSNPGDRWTGGNVVLTDNDSNNTVPMFTITNAKPGDVISSCIKVTYTGNVPANINLFGTTTGSGLDPYLDLTVNRGSISSGSFPDCTNFTADPTNYRGLGAGVVYSGTLQAYPDTVDVAATVDPGATNAPEVWTSGETHAYRFSLTVQDTNAAQGLTATQAFTWQATHATGYSQAVLADTPVGYWQFNETTGTLANDSTLAHDGTLAGSPTLAQSSGVNDAGYAATFDGVNDKVTVGDYYDFANRAPMSVEFWLNPVSLGVYASVVDKMANAPRNGWRIFICPGTSCGGTVSDTAIFERYTAGAFVTNLSFRTTATVGVWRHYVLTYDGSTLKTYVDGQFIGQQADAVGSPDTTTQMRFMVTQGGTWTNASVDEIAIYDYPLTQTQVSNHYTAGRR